MKTIILSLTLASILFVACNNDGSNKEVSDSTASVGTMDKETTENKMPASEILTGYLKLKNALTNDNDKEAADHAKKHKHSENEHKHEQHIILLMNQCINGLYEDCELKKYIIDKLVNMKDVVKNNKYNASSQKTQAVCEHACNSAGSVGNLQRLGKTPS